MLTQRYMNVREVAALLGSSEGAIRKRMQRGQIPFFRDRKTGAIRFDLKDIDRLMDGSYYDPRPKRRV